MSSLVVGLTGGIGSGKTAVSDLFAAKGIDIVDADVIARQVVEPGSPALEKLVERFGPDALDPQGRLNRLFVREQVFKDAGNKTFIDGLLHPLIREQMLQQTQAATSPYCILAIPLLVENQLQSLVQRVLVVDVDEEVQVARASARDNQTAEQVRNILSNQASRAQRLAVADDVINNSGSLEALAQHVDKLHSQYLELAKNPAKG